MSVLGTVRAPLHALAHESCAADLHIARPTAHRPQVRYEHADSPPMPGPSVQLDVGRLSWRRTRAGRYSLEATASATCPACLRPEQLRSLVSSCRGVVASGLTCPVHDTAMLLDEFDLSLGDADGGDVALEIRASASCDACAEPRLIRRPARVTGTTLAEDTITRVGFEDDRAEISSLTPDVLLLVETHEAVEKVLDALSGHSRRSPRAGQLVELPRIGGASVVCVPGPAYPLHRLRPGAVVWLGALMGLRGYARRTAEVVVATQVGVHPVRAELLARLRTAAADWAGGGVHFDAVTSDGAAAAARGRVPAAVIGSTSSMDGAVAFVRHALSGGGWATPVPPQAIDGRVLLRADGRDLGAGFPLTDGLVVTAAHVVRGRDAAQLAFRAASGAAIAVESIDCDDAADLALLRMAGSTGAMPPLAETEPDARWRVVGRPRANDPQLTGTVTAVDHLIENAGGSDIRVLQLQVTEAMADYGGYSGSAVTVEGGVVGVLVEQVHERHRDGARARRASNVLYAVPISFVVRRFRLALAIEAVAA